MIEELKRQVNLYLPKMETGSTFLDAGCHKGDMYDLLINKMKLDIEYTGIEYNRDLYSQAVLHYGQNFIYGDFMNHHNKYDYVWCSQMTFDDNSSFFRHLSGLAKKKLIYTHIFPENGHENIVDTLRIVKDGRFNVVIV